MDKTTKEVLSALEVRIYRHMTDYRWYSKWGLTYEQLIKQRQIAELVYYANMRKIELGIFPQTYYPTNEEMRHYMQTVESGLPLHPIHPRP